MKRKDILLLLGGTAVVSIAWIIFSVYHNFVTSTISEPLVTQIVPINPLFDVQIINQLKQRKGITPIYDIGLTNPQASESAQPVPTEPPFTIETSIGATQGGIQ